MENTVEFKPQLLAIIARLCKFMLEILGGKLMWNVSQYFEIILEMAKLLLENIFYF